ncbi:MFS transporter [Granulicella arctica]|uniref:MFS family permease n=1 Tax=Granulicella arctica TaxID=940613 RepID=A0A7Y9PI70_9BACT|nr:MFS transporter [Granulicella arctica]NYF80282.1 MFS family permease [Granulicella arctica]
MVATSVNTARYGRFLLFIAGLGGLLYGIDVGIIAAALLYLGKTINLSVQQTSVLVAAVLGGGMFSSLVAGVLADWIGRKKMMILSGLLFVVSVALIVLSHGFVPLFLGRLLQGISAGVIAVVVPLYLAECLGAEVRGRGTTIFQLMLTFGIVIAALTGFYYTGQAEAAIKAAAGNATLIHAAQDHAWRAMFLSVIYPGLIFFGGSFFLSETPRWLFRKGKKAEALASLRRSTPEEQAQLQMREMEALASDTKEKAASGERGSLLKRKYVFPFVLACFILSFNQTTGINSVLGFLVIILKQAGMSVQHATQGDVAVKLLNFIMTLAAIGFVDKKGRRFLLRTGTAGIVIAMLTGSFLFYRFESSRIDVAPRVQAAVQSNALSFPVNAATLGPAMEGHAMALTVVYNSGSSDGDMVDTVRNDDPNPVVTLAATNGKPLIIKQATYAPVPAEQTGWLITACLGLFIASYAFGPGVVVWLVLSELMPTRIRSVGMGIGLLLNQGVSTLIAAVFLPVVGRYGYYAMFLFWAVCTAIYFLTASFFLPETKGKTLEEIEAFFDSNASKSPELA